MNAINKTIATLGSSMPHARMIEIYDIFREWSDSKDDKSHLRESVRKMTKRERTYLYAQAIGNAEYLRNNELAKHNAEIARLNALISGRCDTLAELCKDFGINRIK